MASVLLFRRGGPSSAAWRLLQPNAHRPSPNTSSARRTLAFRPRRTPPPSVAGVNLRPRPNPLPSKNDEAAPGAPAGGRGSDPHWISPHHTDYYNRLDASTMQHEELLHGDPHMPHQRKSRGEGRVALDPFGGKARELDGIRGWNKGHPLVSDFDDFDSLDAYLQADRRETDDDLDGEDENEGWDDVDDLEWEYGSDAADAIRGHLSSFQARLDAAGAGKAFSPLDAVEDRMRTIDRLTAAEGSTQDLALKRRSRSEGREYYRAGEIPKLVTGEAGDGFVGESAGEVGKGRGHDADAAFGPSSKVHFPYGKQAPTPTYHPDFPTGSGVGDSPVDAEEEEWMHELNRMIAEERRRELELGEIDETYDKPVIPQKEDMDSFMKERKRRQKMSLHERDADDHELEREEKPDEILEMIKNGEDPNQEAFGPWSEMTIKVDRVQKVERGGTTVRYRALKIGGNGNGAAGFGIGKALTPNEAIVKAGKHCKRNVFYIDRYLNTGLSYDLAGRHNSCKVELRATKPDYGLFGNPLITEILKFSGISDATSKAHGNRNPYNVVYATFKALATHESLEEIAMKRGKKLLNLRRARRLGHA